VFGESALSLSTRRGFGKLSVRAGMQIVARNYEELRAVAAREGDHIVAILSGTADGRVADTIEEIFQAIHRAAVAEGRSVVVDMRSLEFMSSHCLKNLLTWINDIQELEPEQRYQVHFVSNPKIHWQTRSLHVVKCFANDLVTVGHE